MDTVRGENAWLEASRHLDTGESDTGGAAEGKLAIVLIVTGLPRSGTSPVAAMLHRLGCEMGQQCLMPQPGAGFDFEWEDHPFTTMLHHLIRNAEPDEDIAPHRDRLLEYVQQRISYHRDLENSRVKQQVARDWGVKSPFLAPFLNDLKAVCDELREPLSLVLTQRPMQEVMLSIEAQGASLRAPLRREYLAFSRALCDRVQMGLQPWTARADLVIPIHDVWTDPLAVARGLRRLCRSPVPEQAVIYGIEDRSGRTKK